MEHIFRTLTDFATDPFAQLAAARDGRSALTAAGLAPEEIELALSGGLSEIQSVANGGFSSCETCIDPGDDPDPFP